MSWATWSAAHDAGVADALAGRPPRLTVGKHASGYMRGWAVGRDMLMLRPDRYGPHAAVRR
jgi:hypothetical protein